MREFTTSSPDTPCPVCGRTKDGDCRVKEAGALVLCHSYTVGNTEGINRGYKFLKNSDKGAGYGVWAFDATDGKTLPKRPRVLGRQRYTYTDRQGNPIARVNRTDSTDGKSFFQEHRQGQKWVKGLPADIRPAIAPYRFLEFQSALEKGEIGFWVEGESCADALWDIGIPATTTIGGSKGYLQYGTYKDDFQGPQLVLCPDRDSAGLGYMEMVAQDHPDALWCYVYPESVVYPVPWQRLPTSGGLDVADWISEGATKETLLGAVRSRVTPEVAELADTATEFEPCRRLKNIRLLQDHWGDRIRLNELTGNIELDAEPIEIDELPLAIAEEFNKAISKDEAAMIVTRMAKKNPYHPIQEYLERVELAHPDEDGSFIADLSRRYFGTSNPIYDTFVRLTLVGAVRRIFEPGSKHDYTLILQGDQGVRKSSFFRILAGPEWFDDSLGSLSDKDERLKLHRTWFTEWAELETIFGRKDQAAVKAFLTSQIDYVRPPYGREVRPMARRCLIVGTTNRDDFLTDPTGARRFWVIPVQKVIDTTLLSAERDRIYAAAVKLYRTGLHVDLSPEELLQAKELVKEYEPEDPWWNPLVSYCRQWQTVNIPDFMAEVLKIELGRQSRQDHQRLADMLRRLGYSRKRERIDGQCKRVWVQSPPNATHATAQGSLVEGWDQPQSLTGQGIEGDRSRETTELAQKNQVFSEASFSPAHPPSPKNSKVLENFSGRVDLEGLKNGETQSNQVISLDPEKLPGTDQSNQIALVDGIPPPLPPDEVAILAQLLREATQPSNLAVFAELYPNQKEQVWAELAAQDRDRVRQIKALGDSTNGNGKH